MKTNILTLAITLTIGVILAGSLLMPVIIDAQTTMGDPITYTNTSSYGEIYVTEDISGTHTIVMDAESNTITYDSEVISSPTRGYIVVTDAIVVVNQGAYITICYGSDTYQFNASWGNSYDITFEDGTATMIRTSSGGTQTTFTKEYTWIGYKVASGGNYINMSSDANKYLSNMNNLLSVGYYSSGDNDTFYCLKDGEITISETTFTASVALSSTDIVSGTTDVYYAYPVISVDEESYTPYVWAVQKEIYGHQTAGASYELLGAIPIIVIIGLVLAGVGAISIRNRD